MSGGSTIDILSPFDRIPKYYRDKPFERASVIYTEDHVDKDISNDIQQLDSSMTVTIASVPFIITECDYVAVFHILRYRYLIWSLTE